MEKVSYDFLKEQECELLLLDNVIGVEQEVVMVFEFH